MAEDMTKKYIPKANGHIWQCRICEEMEKRGYRSEEKYWADMFDGKLRPIKYNLSHD